MKLNFRSIAVAFALNTLLLAGTLAPQRAQAQAREEARLLVATQVLEELRATRDQYIPDYLLERAYGIAVIPDVIKVGFGVGGRRGSGVLMVRDKQGRFSAPVFVSLTGGSIGWQIGAQSTDVVLVFTTRAGIDGISDGKVTLGADASVAAGPVGRTASAATDASFSAEIYSYSRSRGLFAGVALDGSVLSIDRRFTARYYGNRASAADVMSGAVTKNSESIRRLMTAVSTSTASAGRRGADLAPATSTPVAPPVASTPPAAPTTAPADGAARSFPMEDNKPGQEPPK